jgi:imidazolonepropionase-like amidohydrolase
MIRAVRRSRIGLAALALLAAASAHAAPTAPATAPAKPGLDPVSGWRSAVPEQPGAVLVRNATIWTSGAAGVLENADLLVRRGKVAAVGKGLAAPAGALVVDGTGLHVTAGIIDAHSHTAVDGAVNEGTNAVTAEVRIGDVLDPDDVNIYRELAGGLTVANVLHGSANAIGGQNQVIKLRWGSSADALKFEGAPPGIKFALGENPKQSNWNPTEKRFPQTRMGVQELIRERFQAARDYRRQAQEFAIQKRKGAVPPRTDLQLEAIAEILEGRRLVHSHSYRADEILMLIRLADEFGVKIATFQHALESYKVAAEVAKHGAGASMFCDWWAYKFEVYDAIPWAGAIDWQKGVVVSFNSDSNELARRLNLEAAKALRYGGVPAAEALKFVTLNPAQQLGIAARVGSVEVGKDADFVIWSGDPLSNRTICLQTWIDGRRYFDRAADLALRPALDEERKALIAKVRAASDKEKADKKRDEKPREETPPPGTAPAPPPPNDPEEVTR